ncbi:hypothetical protein QYE76_071738 [Lolium multiflorum]|uniref:GAG-pre-integrase domain-containing protein n=1 Tax=Lolium multiflorum TaxID=4521 RepID=A0AAD8SLX2_LOLMU|nr:hypothetical protein QYE76_071738 [Lolium multiflorum]
MLHTAMSNGQHQPQHPEWIMDSGASSHITGQTGNLTSSRSTLGHNSQYIVVDNGSKLPILAIGAVQISSLPLHLQDVLVSPHIVKNLISVRKFSRDNFVSIEFDPYGFSVKDLATKTLLYRSNSDGDLYPFFGSKDLPSSAALTTSSGDLWHRRLGHPSKASLSLLPLDFLQSTENPSPDADLPRTDAGIHSGIPTRSASLRPPHPPAPNLLLPPNPPGPPPTRAPPPGHRTPATTKPTPPTPPTKLGDGVYFTRSLGNPKRKV